MDARVPGWGSRGRVMKNYFHRVAASIRRTPRLTPGPPIKVLSHSSPNFNDVYAIGSVIHIATRYTLYHVTHIDSCVGYACKRMFKGIFQLPHQMDAIRSEIEVLKAFVGDPDVVQFVNALEDPEYLYLVMELLEGKPLMGCLAESTYFIEVKAARVFKTILRVLDGCHSRGVLHRDVRPKNFILSERDDAVVIKAIGFHNSVFCKPGDLCTEKVGDRYYVSPEILGASYGPEADIWSAGVLLYLMLCGSYPFQGDSETEIFEAICKANLRFDFGTWLIMSSNAKDFLGKMICSKSERWSAHQLLEHPWIHALVGPDTEKTPPGHDPVLIRTVISRLGEYASMNDFKKLAMTAIAKSLCKKKDKRAPGPLEMEFAQLDEMFKLMETETMRKDTVTVEHLKAVLSKDDALFQESGFLVLIYLNEVVASNNGTIGYVEFISATIDSTKLEDHHLKVAFDYFGSEYISVEDVQERFSKRGMNPGHALNIFKEVFKNQGRNIDYSEFLDMMTKKEDEFYSIKDSLDSNDSEFYSIKDSLDSNDSSLVTSSSSDSDSFMAPSPPDSPDSSHTDEPNLLRDHPRRWLYCLYLVFYIIAGCVCYLAFQFLSDDTQFSGGRSLVSDGLYFAVSTITTVGYGDVVPLTVSAKLLTINYLVVGIFLMSAAFLVISQGITDVEDNMLQGFLRNIGRARARILLSSGYCILCIIVGIVALCFWEGMSGIQAIYVSIASVTTLGFGDASFKSQSGRLFASLWLLPSTISVLRLTSLASDWLIACHH